MIPDIRLCAGLINKTKATEEIYWTNNETTGRMAKFVDTADQSVRSLMSFMDLDLICQFIPDLDQIIPTFCTSPNTSLNIHSKVFNTGTGTAITVLVLPTF